MKVGVKTNFELLTPSLSWIAGKILTHFGVWFFVMTFCKYILSEAMFSTQLNNAHFIVLASFDLREENNSLIDLLLCSVWLCFLKTACARIFFFLEAPTSISKNSLLVTRCALFWNTITFKHRRRAIGFGENKFDNITRYYSVLRSGDTFRLYP